MRTTLRNACLLLATVSPAAVSAQTAISSTTTSNIRTSTVANGSADNISITSAGGVTPTSGTAVTIDSNNTVANAGNVAINSADNSTGIAASGGLTSGITNSGTIRIDDSYAAADTNGDGVIDGPFAQGTGRTGILINGTGTFTGNIINSGQIIVEGNNSAGVSSTVAIAGGFQSTGAISVLGDNGTAIRLGAVSGTVAIAGAVTATGQNDVGVALTGNVGGGVVIHNTITSSGYSANVAPTDPSTLGADNLLQGGSAVVVGGNIAGGLLIGASLTATTDTTVDTDADGIGDSTEAAGALVTYGAAPTLQIGSAANAVTLGPVSAGTTTYTAGLVNNGSIAAFGVYNGVNATAVQVGGLGQAVTLVGGINNSGTITASSIGGSATALLVGSGASVPVVTNSGTLYAYGGTLAGGNAQTILIAQGASLPSIVNSGTISTVTSIAGGNASAIVDKSGTLTSIANTGIINVIDTDNNGIAIDVRSNTTGFTYTQSLASSTSTAPSLTGAILTGSGGATIAASAGTITSTITTGAGPDVIALSGAAAYSGTASLGAGDNAVTLADTSSFSGSVDFGSGASNLSIGSGAAFSGQIANSTASHVAVSVASGGTFGLTGTGVTNLSSLALAGTLAITADPASGTASQLVIAGATTISPGAILKVSLSSLSLNPIDITVLRSGTLSGSANLGLTIASLPYILTGSLTPNDAAGTIGLTVGPRPVTMFGFRPNEGAAYPAVLAAITSNAALSGLFLGLTDQASTVQRYRQMLPDYEGGAFDMLARGTRTLAQGPNATPLGSHGDINVWAQQAFWNGTQKADLTPGFRGYGWGLVIGADVGLGGFGRAGLSLGYLYVNADNSVDNKVSANDFQLGAHWVAKWGGLRVSAQGSAGYVRLSSLRNISGVSSISPDLLTSRAHWGGMLTAANAAASYQFDVGLFYVKPSATLDYARLHENKYAEDDGGVGYDLAVAARTSSELSATGLVALGIQFGGRKDPEETAFRFELEGGRYQLVNSNIGSTTAQFGGGTAFTLDPEATHSGYIANARVSVGTDVFNFSATAGTERREDYHGLVGRLALRMGF